MRLPDFVNEVQTQDTLANLHPANQGGGRLSHPQKRVVAPSDMV
jgi:hypothetical protein